MNILITSANAKVPLIKAFKATKAKIFTQDIRADYAAQYFADGIIKLPTTDDPNYAQILLNNCQKFAIAMIIPTSDRELPKMAELRPIFLQSNIEIIVSPLESVQIAQNKRQFVQFCLDNDLPIMNLIPEKPKLPIFFRPNQAHHIYKPTKIETQDHYEFLKSQFPDGVFQDFIHAPEYSIDGICDLNGNFVQAIARQRIATKGGEVIISQTKNMPRLIDLVKKIINILPIIGHFNCQLFMLPNDTISLIEINLRFGGGSAFSIACGLNSPQYLQDMVNKNFAINSCNRLIYDKKLLRYSADILI